MKKPLTILAAACLAALVSAAPAPFRPGEKALFFGDSITHGGRYIRFIELMLDSRGVPGAELLNSGRSGGSAASGLKRIQHDVIDRGPTRVFVLYGMNDVGRYLYQKDTPENRKYRAERLAAYSRNMTEIVDLLQRAGITVVLMTPTAYDQYQPDGESMHCNEPGLSDIADLVRRLAAEKKLDVIELHPAMTAMLKAHPELRVCGKDLVHPVPMGHLAMAALIMEQLGMTGPTAEVELSADGKAAARYAAVADVRTEPGKVSFRYAPGRMALALPAWEKDLEKIYPFHEKFNRETLKVAGLAPGEYALSAGNAELGTFSAEQLAAGIDLGKLNTPNRARAEQAMALCEKSGGIVRQLRSLEMSRGIAVGFAPKTDRNDIAAVSAALDAWYAKLPPTNPALRYWAQVIELYKKNAPKEKTLVEESARLRRAMAESARPVAYDITIQKKEK